MDQGRESVNGGRRNKFRAGRTAHPGINAKSFSIRLTKGERAALRDKAGCLPVAVYVRNRLLGEEGVAVRRRRKGAPIQDHEVLARVLALLGQSRIANNLNQLAKAVNIGALPVTPETEAEIQSACAAVVDMRADLMRALGLMEDRSHDP